MKILAGIIFLHFLLIAIYRSESKTVWILGPAAIVSLLVTVYVLFMLHLMEVPEP